MHDQRSHACPEDGLAPTAADDDAMQAAVLSHLLILHPAQLSEAELRRELGGVEVEFAESDAIARAVSDLVAVGLLHRHGEFLFPTRAAVCFHALPVG